MTELKDEIHQGAVEDKEVKNKRREMLRAAKKAQAASFILLNDDRDGTLTSVHLGASSVWDTLRICDAHREIADALETAIVESTGMTKEKLTAKYQEIEDDTFPTTLASKYSVIRKKR